MSYFARRFDEAIDHDAPATQVFFPNRSIASAQTPSALIPGPVVEKLATCKSIGPMPLKIDPQNFWAHLFLSFAYEQKGMVEEAFAERERASAVEGGNALPDAIRRRIYERRGYVGYLRMLAAKGDVISGPVGSSSLALLNARLGEREAAFRWLEKSYESHTRDLIYLSVEPGYDTLRSDPRFVDLVRRVGLPTEGIPSTRARS